MVQSRMGVDPNNEIGPPGSTKHPKFPDASLGVLKGPVLLSVCRRRPDRLPKGKAKKTPLGPDTLGAAVCKGGRCFLLSYKSKKKSERSKRHDRGRWMGMSNLVTKSFWSGRVRRCSMDPVAAFHRYTACPRATASTCDRVHARHVKKATSMKQPYTHT